MLNSDFIANLLINNSDSDSEDDDDCSTKLKEQIIEFVTNFKDLPKEEVIESEYCTQHIIRSDNIIKFQPPYNIDEVNSFHDFV